MAVYHKHISAKHNYFALKLDEVWQYRDLILLFTHKTFTVKYKQTILGPLWLILVPVITSLMHMLVFGKIAGLSTDGIPQFMFYMLGTAVWNYFGDCLTGNSNTFSGNSNLFGKVYFPRLTVPIANVLVGIIKFGIQMALVMCVLVYYVIKGVVSPDWIYMPLMLLVIIWLGLMGMGVGIIISSCTTKYRDLNVLVGFGVTLWMYATPVVYPISQIQDGFLKNVIMCNPVCAPVEVSRYIFTGCGQINATSIAVSAVFTLMVTLLGIVIFNKVERTFMDTV